MYSSLFVFFSAYYWVDTTARSAVPTTALHGGHDIDGAEIYVGRAFHEGDWIPAKVIPSRNVAYVAYGGGEHAKDNFQVNKIIRHGSNRFCSISYKRSIVQSLC